MLCCCCGRVFIRLFRLSSQQLMKGCGGDVLLCCGVLCCEGCCHSVGGKYVFSYNFSALVKLEGLIRGCGGNVLLCCGVLCYEGCSYTVGGGMCFLYNSFGPR